MAGVPDDNGGSPDKVLTQRKYGVELTFRFGADHLDYTLRDRSGERRLPVRYEAIALLEPSELEVNHTTRYAGMASCAALVCLIFAFVTAAHDTLISHLFFGLFGMSILFSIYAQKAHLFNIRYTVFPIGPNTERMLFRVMQSNSQQEIMQELRARWKECLRKLYAPIDFMGDIDKEIAKFGWLRAHSVITDGEHDEALAKLRAYAARQQQASDTRPP